MSHFNLLLGFTVRIGKKIAFKNACSRNQYERAGQEMSLRCNMQITSLNVVIGCRRLTVRFENKYVVDASSFNFALLTEKVISTALSFNNTQATIYQGV